MFQTVVKTFVFAVFFIKLQQIQSTETREFFGFFFCYSLLLSKILCSWAPASHGYPCGYHNDMGWTFCFAQTSSDIFFRTCKNKVFKWSFVLKPLLLTNYSQVSMLLFKCQTQFFYFWRFILLTVTMCSHEGWPPTCFLFVVFCQTGMTKPLTVFGFGLQQQKNLEGYVGFANLPNQVYRKSVKRGFEFTLMVVGE